ATPRPGPTSPGRPGGRSLGPSKPGARSPADALEKHYSAVGSLRIRHPAVSSSADTIYFGWIRRYTPGEPCAWVIASRMGPERGDEPSRCLFDSAVTETFSCS